MQPKGVLIDCGGTLLEEPTYNRRHGNKWLMDRAASNPREITIDQIMERVAVIDREVIARRDDCCVETPWPMLTKLIYDFFNIQFDCHLAELELGFWKASMETRPMPGAVEALEELHRKGIPIGVVSNSIFGSSVIRYELDRHGLADHLQFVISSADYAVRKPGVLIFEIAAAKLGSKPVDLWYVGDRLDIDVYGSGSAGMTPVWFGPPKGSPSPCLSVTDWGDFVVRLRENGGAKPPDSKLTIRRAQPPDVDAITEIYNEAILTTTATFDTTPKTASERLQWLASHDERHPVIVAELNGTVVGWASLSRWSDRSAYSDTAETSFYVKSAYRGRGAGRKLKQAIIDEARRQKFHTLIARIAEGGDASLHLNESFGFVRVGTMKAVGRKFGRRLDVHILQKMLSSP